jgi:bifunctional ADP-heptose synthase (sugar kinase/adenylyltransferase)
VTLGADGLIAFERLAQQDKGWSARVRGEHVPALAPHAVDSLGCGDALLSSAVLALTAGASLTDAAFLGSVAAAAQAARLGNTVISAADLRAGVKRCESARLTISPSTPTFAPSRLAAL